MRNARHVRWWVETHVEDIQSQNPVWVEILGASDYADLCAVGGNPNVLPSPDALVYATPVGRRK
jgi:hypothetical protein